MKLEFNSRDTYLAQVTLWKETYAQHSQQIRDTRRAFRQAQSDDSKGNGSWATVERWRSEVASLRDEATALIADRHESKAEAERQFRAQREAKAVAA